MTNPPPPPGPPPSSPPPSSTPPSSPPPPGPPPPGQQPASRQPLDQARLALELPSLNGPWTAVEVTPRTGSTNADLLEWAARGLAEGAILVAEEQTAGRGRMGRAWVSPPGAALTFSVLLRPDKIPSAQRGWLPLIAGIAAATGVRMLTGLDARLKWPNDLLIGGRKLAGILAEASGDAVVIGIGINVSTAPEELPVGPGGLAPTSLLAEGASVERDLLLIETLRSFGSWYKTLTQEPDPERIGLLGQYRNLSATIGHEVRVELPTGAALSGLATGIDVDGRLLVEADGGIQAIAAGDVIHVRLCGVGLCASALRGGRASFPRRWQHVRYGKRSDPRAGRDAGRDRAPALASARPAVRADGGDCRGAAGRGGDDPVGQDRAHRAARTCCRGARGPDVVPDDPVAALADDHV